MYVCGAAYIEPPILYLIHLIREKDSTMTGTISHEAFDLQYKWKMLHQAIDSLVKNQSGLESDLRKIAHMSKAGESFDLLSTYSTRVWAISFDSDSARVDRLLSGGW